jgi:hypothetical protein
VRPRSSLMHLRANTAQRETELIEWYFAMTPRKREETWKIMSRDDRQIVREAEADE